MVKRAVRRIIKIDEEKCNGCGLCVPSCAEGAIKMIDGKARLVADALCDGIGNCLGECPQDAISIDEREADDFDEALAHQMTQQLAPQPARPPLSGCPGSMMRSRRPAAGLAAAADGQCTESQLTNWPVQLMLLSPAAPYLRGAKLLISSDCVPFAFADFHRQLLPGRVVAVGCPKLDDADYYQEKLTEILRLNDVESVEVAFMEVPCCHRLVQVVGSAMQAAGCTAPLRLVRIGIDGGLQSGQTVQAEARASA